MEQISICDPDIIICCGQQIKGGFSNAEILEKNVLKISAEWDKFRSCDLPKDWGYFYAEINDKQVPVVSFCHPQVTNLCGRRGHEGLFKPLYKDMQVIGNKFLRIQE